MLSVAVCILQNCWPQTSWAQGAAQKKCMATSFQAYLIEFLSYHHDRVGAVVELEPDGRRHGTQDREAAPGRGDPTKRMGK